jgi:hypothetical protein
MLQKKENVQTCIEIKQRERKRSKRRLDDDQSQINDNTRHFISVSHRKRERCEEKNQ